MERTRFWIGVASRDHVRLGVAGGFAQLNHGKAAPLRRMAAGDWIVYYSGRESLSKDTPCRRFTAIGQVLDDRVYQAEMADGFRPFRRDIRFLDGDEAEIAPLLDRLSFIPDKRHWGYPFRRGHLEVPEADFTRIAESMLGRERWMRERRGGAG